MNLIQRLLFSIFLLLIGFSCANIGRPNGGPIDITPPRLVKSTPLQNQTYFKKKKIEVEFDEIVLVESPSEKVTISPPQTNPPEISTSGRKIIVELKDSLRKNTTYTVDFSDAIVDNNEKNPFNNFSLAFSTGGYVDSLEVSGTLLNAADLEPITGMYVGLHKLLDDSAFIKNPFDRATRSDVYGRFTLKNVAAGRYRIYALKDANRDYKFDQSGEDIAFSDSIVLPSFTYVEAADTIRHKLKGVKDSIRTIQKKIFSPNQLLLRGFNENFKSQYLDKSERKQRNRLNITFAAAAQSLPKIRPLNFPSKNWAKIERSATNDTLSYWIKDSTIYKQDTLLLEATYLHTDSLKQLIPQTDTLRFVFHDPKISTKKKKKDDKTKVVIPSLSVDARFGSILDVYEDMIFTMQTPLDSVLLRKIRFEEKKDTTWKTLKLPPLMMDSLNIRRYTMHYKWLPGKEYRLTVDSATFYGINGLCNKEIKKTFKIKDLEQYSGLFMKIVGITGDAFVELLNESDKPVRTEAVIKGVAEFYYLNPGTYYARLVSDRNSNYKWDTGNYAKKLQPEEVFYYDGTLELRPNWDVEQEWNVRAKPIERQKPLKLVKNKPKEKTPIGGIKGERGGR
jgi:uncharacterized protein (DUF2141 family)